MAWPEWLDAIVKAIAGMMPKDFVGSIEINVFKGGISNVNVKQSYKR